MASKTVTRSIISIFDGIPLGIPGPSTVETGAVLSWDMIALVLSFSDKAVYPPKSTSKYKIAVLDVKTCILAFVLSVRVKGLFKA